MRDLPTGDASAPAALVRRFWDHIQARDWSAVRDVLAQDAVLDFPHTGERFVGADAIVAINAEYPEGWQIHVLRIIEQGEQVVAEVEVPQQGVGIFRVASLSRVHQGRIASMVEYWVGVGQQQAPAWRERHAAPPP